MFFIAALNKDNIICSLFSHQHGAAVEGII